MMSQLIQSKFYHRLQCWENVGTTYICSSHPIICSIYRVRGSVAHILLTQSIDAAIMCDAVY